MTRSAVVVLPLLALMLAGGCAQSRTVTITTRPPDAVIQVDGVQRGRGRVVQQFKFGSANTVHRVTATRLGYKDEVKEVTLDNPSGPTLAIEMKPHARRVMFNISPVPAYVSVNGKPTSPDPVSLIPIELEFTVDARNKWIPHTVTAERKGFAKATVKVDWEENKPQYDLVLQPLKKDLTIRTSPAGAQVLINGESFGTSPVTYKGFPFPVDADTGEFIPHRLTVRKLGYDDVDATINYEDEADYLIDLSAKSKQVRVLTTPPGASVRINGIEMPRPAGVATSRLEFPPVDETGTLRTFKAKVSKTDPDSIWEPQDLEIGWDGGRKDYTVQLKEIKTRDVPLLRWRPTHTADGWQLVPERAMTVGIKDVIEPAASAGAKPPFRVYRAPKGTTIDSLAVSPDGTQVAYATLTSPADGALKWAIALVGTDGVPGPVLALDPESQELTPSFSPDGGQVVFSSNRAGRGYNVWAVPSAGGGGATQLTSGESSDLWPFVDSDPRPRVFYQALFHNRSAPRLYSTRIGTSIRTDLGEPGASQPRVSPKGDSVVYALADAKTGKRDLFQIPDTGGQPFNLTNTPDVDEFDAAWSPDGGAIAFASDRGVDTEKRRNVDVWVMDMRSPERPRQITTNGSLDDCPGWDPTGEAIYFRSNRAGEWGIWKIEVR